MLRVLILTACTEKFNPDNFLWEDVRPVFFMIIDVLNLCNYVYSKYFSRYNVINLITLCGELYKICK